MRGRWEREGRGRDYILLLGFGGACGGGSLLSTSSRTRPLRRARNNTPRIISEIYYQLTVRNGHHSSPQHTRDFQDTHEEKGCGGTLGGWGLWGSSTISIGILSI